MARRFKFFIYSLIYFSALIFGHQAVGQSVIPPNQCAIITGATKDPEFALDTSPTKRVGGTVTKNFRTVKHKYRMLSLGNSYSKEDIEDFEIRIKKLVENELEYIFLDNTT